MCCARGLMCGPFSTTAERPMLAGMDNPVILRGYAYSMYTRIARVALVEKGVAFETEEIDPFSGDVPAEYLARHPFGRVPVLSHGDFDIYETAAIARYVDAAFDGPALMPDDVKARARIAQVVSVVDNYGFRPLVLQVFGHRVFRPAVGVTGDESVIADGIKTSLPVLDALNGIAAEGLALDGQTFTLADVHLAPVIAYFAQAPEGAAALHDYPVLAGWWSIVKARESITVTDPGLPKD